ncbi:actin interacting protein 3 [Zalerion maritima]|uniref:Actin interacting protein 3 n=1 Tax=Zalerion maritima TaxID=339359 RepID=A0AAD5RYQ2_9PEZI|nr:actin interacting protein 3 [Zalerion maritima]
MQPSSSQRSLQRRSPGIEPGPPPSVPLRAISPAAGMQPRGSTASNRSAQSAGSTRRSNRESRRNLEHYQVIKSHRVAPDGQTVDGFALPPAPARRSTISLDGIGLHRGQRRIERCLFIPGFHFQAASPHPSNLDWGVSAVGPTDPQTVSPHDSCFTTMYPPRGPSLRQPAQANDQMGSRAEQSSNQQVPLSQIEKSVTHLLVATKSLLETLTQWSKGKATDTQVSDVYVRLGYEFNMACRAFTAINVDTSDLGNVPELLRHILEATLSQEASVESLEKYLPRIRDIIINLLQGLKRKQQKLRQKQSGRDRDGGVGPAGGGIDRVTSTGTTGSGSSNLTNMLDEGIENGGYTGATMPPRRGDSIPGTMSNTMTNPNQSPSRRVQREPSSRGTQASQSDQSSVSSNTMQQLPVQPPYPSDEASIPTSNNEFSIDSFPPPPPPPKQTSALAALQRGGDLERRASRRYSQYQVSKLLGGTNGVPMLPTQTGPVPNRGRREMRESMQAVQSREDRRHNRNVSKQPKAEFSPAPKTEETPNPAIELPASGPAAGEKGAIPESPANYRTSATISGPIDDLPAFPVDRDESPEKQQQTREKKDGPPQPQATPPPEKRETSFSSPAQSPPLTKDLTLFLQYKSKVKKFVLPEGFNELSIGRLQLAFIEKFSWNTQQNGADLPDIYIQDPVSGIRHELEDLSDIKDRTVLVLNIEALDEVKKHIDEGIGSIRQIVEQVKQNMDDQGQALQRVSDRQQEAAKDMARMAAAPPTVISDTPSSVGGSSSSSQPSRKMSVSQLKELQTLRRDLAVMRQTYSNFQSEIQNSISTLRSKASRVKEAGSKAALPNIDGNVGSSYVSKGRTQMNKDSDKLVGRVDDLQDLVEDLRKDVVHRGVRPRPNQLENVGKDIMLANKELKKMEDYIKQEKPVWTKIWEKELEEVCQSRDELRLMEDLMIDLKDDLEKATETFGLVEQATKEQMKEGGVVDAAGAVAGGKLLSRGLENLGGVDNVTEVRDDVLGQVRALQPNHENRLEAIQRAERQRKKELESRNENPLHKEITLFVGEGKLKKSGGFEEVERARKAKDERIRREVWERQNGIVSMEPEEEQNGREGAGE